MPKTKTTRGVNASPTAQQDGARYRRLLARPRPHETHQADYRYTVSYRDEEIGELVFAPHVAALLEALIAEHADLTDHDLALGRKFGRLCDRALKERRQGKRASQ